MGTILVVANQTLASGELQQALHQRAGDAPPRVWIVVPATDVADQHVQVAMTPSAASGPVNLQAPYPTEDRSAVPDGYTVAAERLEHGLRMARALGCIADGEVGDKNPRQAVDAFLAQHRVDEVIVCTLPHHLSRWLRMDLAGHIQRHHHLPVTTVTASVPAGATA